MLHRGSFVGVQTQHFLDNNDELEFQTPGNLELPDQNLLQHRNTAFAFKRIPSDEHSEEQNTEGPNVGLEALLIATVVGFLLDDFGSQVGGSARVHVDFGLESRHYV